MNEILDENIKQMVKNLIIKHFHTKNVKWEEHSDLYDHKMLVKSKGETYDYTSVERVSSIMNKNEKCIRFITIHDELWVYLTKGCKKSDNHWIFIIYGIISVLFLFVCFIVGGFITGKDKGYYIPELMLPQTNVQSLINTYGVMRGVWIFAVAKIINYF
jgi:hypothetical protein